ncbi:phosphatase PAP2 family protein [Nonomuraea gerenzanensis]|nr:phosphatase PAP2 family protein [Nonomuraea gerenzanensis]UBU17976.1 phosphatase PAP2 family protein [Nonomuraea gerenzanensis]
MTLVVVWYRDRLADSTELLAGYAGAAVFLLALAEAERRLPVSKVVRFLRFSGPFLVLPLAYSAAARASRVVHGRYLDGDLHAWETTLLGFAPNPALTAAIGSPLMTEVLTFCYFSFYGCFLVPAILYAWGRVALAERYVFAALAVFLPSYLGFIAIPLIGPALALPESFAAHGPSGHAITALQNEIMAAFDPPGACFPSTHVAGAWITLLCLRRHVPRSVGAMLWVLTAGLTVAVVYDWYHYLSDAAAGLAVALLVHAVTERFAARRARPRSPG